MLHFMTIFGIIIENASNEYKQAYVWSCGSWDSLWYFHKQDIFLPLKHVLLTWIVFNWGFIMCYLLASSFHRYDCSLIDNHLVSSCQRGLSWWQIVACWLSVISPLSRQFTFWNTWVNYLQTCKDWTVQIVSNEKARYVYNIKQCCVSKFGLQMSTCKYKMQLYCDTSKVSFWHWYKVRNSTMES